MPRKKDTPTQELLEFPARLTMAMSLAKVGVREAARRCGITAGQISRYKRGESVAGIQADLIIRMAQALNVSVGWLIAGEGVPTPGQHYVLMVQGTETALADRVAVLEREIKRHPTEVSVAASRERQAKRSPARAPSVHTNDVQVVKRR